MHFRHLGIAVAAILAAPTSAEAQDVAANAERNWAEIVRCAAIDSARNRQACMDDVVRRAGVVSDEQIAQRTEREFGRDNEPPSPVAALPVAQSAPARPIAQPEEIDEVASTIASVRTVGYKRLRVTTSEGAIWEQVQAETFNSPPRVGDAFSIERTSLGGYRCQFRNMSRYYCQRVD